MSVSEAAVHGCIVKGSAELQRLHALQIAGEDVEPGQKCFVFHGWQDAVAYLHLKEYHRVEVDEIINDAEKELRADDSQPLDEIDILKALTGEMAGPLETLFRDNSPEGEDGLPMGNENCCDGVYSSMLSKAIDAVCFHRVAEAFLLGVQI